LAANDYRYLQLDVEQIKSKCQNCAE